MAVRPSKLPFSLCVKPIFAVHSVHALDRHRITFPTDGYVFTSLSLPVYPFRMRSLAAIKWKPGQKESSAFNENTVDVVLHSESHDGYDLPTLDGAHPDVGKFRSTNGSLVMVVPGRDGEPIVFSHLHPNPDLEIVEGDTYEVRWRHDQCQWEVFRHRDKHPNTLDTVLRCVTNIIENISLSDIISPVS
jgi:hypothetical protein